MPIISFQFGFSCGALGTKKSDIFKQQLIKLAQIGQLSRDVDHAKNAVFVQVEYLCFIQTQKKTENQPNLYYMTTGQNVSIVLLIGAQSALKDMLDVC